MRRGYNEKEKALLDEMSRAIDPTAEARLQLEYELEHSEAARKAFVAEYVRRGEVLALARANKRALPRRVADALARTQKPKNFDHLVELSQAEPELPTT